MHKAVHNSILLFVGSALATVLLAGCHFYDIVQTNVFANDDGQVVSVDYGRASSEHVNTFRSPSNGKEVEFRSKLVVRVTLPDGDRFTAWQCMNFQRSGTMYKTDDGEWMVLANGFTCIVYRQDEQDETRYQEVFRGVLCDTPEREVKKDDRWKVVPKEQGTYKKEK